MKPFLIGLLVLLVLICAVGLVMPTEYAVERRLDIAAPAAVIHPWIDDLQKWEQWTPWVEDDPSIVTTYGTLTAGVGASQSWTSDSGNGELTLTRSDPATGIAYEMAFVDGDMRAPASCEMRLEPKGEGTTVTWTMRGDAADFMPPVVRGLMRPLLESEIGAMFDRGLENLRARAES